MNKVNMNIRISPDLKARMARTNINWSAYFAEQARLLLMSGRIPDRFRMPKPQCKEPK